MERSVTRTTRWVAFATLLGPVAVCWADSPEQTVEKAPAAVEVAPVSIPVEHAADIEVKEVPLFRHASYPAAWTAAQESNRPILVYVSMPQCPHCSKMLEQSYGSPDVNGLVKGSFETLEVSRYTHASLISKLHVKWYPTTVLVGSNNKVLDMIEGYVDANTFKRRLQLGIASANTNTQTR
jgi:Thioredoxin-like domain